jgi:hypothetical protein
MIPNCELPNYQSQKGNFTDQIPLELFKKLIFKTDKENSN